MSDPAAETLREAEEGPLFILSESRRGVHRGSPSTPGFGVMGWRIPSALRGLTSVFGMGNRSRIAHFHFFLRKRWVAFSPATVLEGA